MHNSIVRENASFIRKYRVMYNDNLLRRRLPRHDIMMRAGAGWWRSGGNDITTAASDASSSSSSGSVSSTLNQKRWYSGFWIRVESCCGPHGSSLGCSHHHCHHLPSLTSSSCRRLSTVAKSSSSTDGKNNLSAIPVQQEITNTEDTMDTAAQAPTSDRLQQAQQPRADSRRLKSSSSPSSLALPLSSGEAAAPVSSSSSAEESGTTETPSATPRLRQLRRYYSPLQELNQFYRTRLGLPNTKGYFALEMVRIVSAGSNSFILPLDAQKKIKTIATTPNANNINNKEEEDRRLDISNSNSSSISRSLVYEVWCAAFTCPLTQRVFLSGTLYAPDNNPTTGNMSDPTSTRGDHNHDTTTTTNTAPPVEVSASTGSPMVIVTGNGDRRVFYSKKNVAVQAAAGRAMDVLQWEHLNILEPRFCLELPYNYNNNNNATTADTATADTTTPVAYSSSAAVSTDNVPSTSHNNNNNNNNNTVAEDQQQQEQLQPISVENKESFYADERAAEPTGGSVEGGAPTRTLKYASPATSSDIYEVGTEAHVAGADNAAAAANPYQIATAEKPRGDVATKGNLSHRSSIRGLSSEDMPEILAGRNSTSDVKTDENGRWSRFVAGSAGDAEIRESHYSAEEAVAGPFTAAYDVLVDSDEQPIENAFRQIEDDDADSLYVSTRSSGEDRSEDDGDEEQDYVLTTMVTPQGKPPVARVLEAMTSQESPIEARRNLPLPIGMPARITAAGERTAAMQIANAWVNAHKQDASDESRSNPHRLILRKQDSATMLPMAKLVLSRLAQSTQFIPTLQVKGVQASADRILELLWETKDSKPDADAMALYLKCLEGTDVKDVALRAKEIVQDMKDARPWKGGRVLPNPNVRTISALIQLHAQMGGTAGRYRDVDNSFQPDRESFLSLLSSATYIPVVPGDLAGFDAEFAARCVARMEELAEKDPRLQPAADVYNAPLRWCGGSIFHHSRPYARAIPWDKYAKMFRREYLQVKANERDQFLMTATAMDKWLQEMESKGDPLIAPTIETYEAVIQAWLRTISRQGLDRAEQLALTLLENGQRPTPLVPRLQTIHPIVASLLFANESDAPVRIAQWIERLESLHNVFPGLRPDGRMMEALISSLVAKQSSLMTKGYPHQVDEALLQELLDSALQCSDVLNKACSRLTLFLDNTEGSDIFLEAGIFAMTISAWQNLALASTEADRVDLFEQSLREIFRIVSKFESTIQLVAAAEAKDCIGLAAPREYSWQLQQLIGHSGSVYSMLIDTFRTLLARKATSSNRAIDPSNYQPLFLAWVERSVQRTAEFIEIEGRDFLTGRSNDSNHPNHQQQETVVSDHGDLNEGGSGLYYDNWCPWRIRVTYDDYFHYRPDDTPKPSKLSFLWRTSEFLKEVTLSTAHDSLGQMGAVARIGGLIKQICATVGTFNRLVRSIDETLDRIMMKSRSGSDQQEQPEQQQLPQQPPQQQHPQSGGRPPRPLSSPRLMNARTSTVPRPKLRTGRRPTLARVKLN